MFRGPPDRAVEIYLLLKGPSLVLLELGLKVAAPHFQAELSPGPDIPHCSPHLLHVQGVTEVSHHLLELLQSAGLDSSDLCLAIAPEVVVTWSLVGAARRPRDLRVTVLPEITRVPNFSLIHSSERLLVCASFQEPVDDGLEHVVLGKLPWMSL